MRLYDIHMVQRQSYPDHWINVKAFVSKESAHEYVKSCESISRNNVMRIEKEILLTDE